MNSLISNIILALNAEDIWVQQSAIRTLEEIIPLIENKEIKLELRHLLEEIMLKEIPEGVKKNIEEMVQFVDAYVE
jgi:hypothetical protein